jgi:transposase
MPEPTLTVYAGLDIAKASLQLHFQDRQQALANSVTGHKKLLALLEPCPQIQIVCEATGGYERPVASLNPGHVRHFALSQGGRAKSDPPAGEHTPDAFILKQQAKLGKHLEAQLKAVEKELAQLAASSADHQKQVDALDEMPGVGFITAITVLCHLPELGQLNRQQAAALAGLAPWTRQSGPWKGQRHIGGGRAVVLAKHKNTTLGRFYHHLRDQGKPAKAALTAGMRKLIVHMNQILKEHALAKAKNK